MEFGEYKLDVINDGYVWLDGGAMFGVVPRPLWSRLIKPDGSNRIPLATNCLLLRGPGGKILIETGVGEHLSAKQKEIFNFEPTERRLIGGLLDLGISPEDIDMVIQTHLHFDHVGHLTRPEPGGGFRPTFANAEIIVQRAEWEAAFDPDPRSAPSYYPREFWEAVRSTGRLRLLEGSEEVAPGIIATPMGGHTPGHQVVEVRQGGETAVYLGDFIPKSQHLGIPYIMAYDLYPLLTLEHKRAFLPRALEERRLLVFEHDHEMPLARLTEESGKLRAVPLA